MARSCFTQGKFDADSFWAAERAKARATEPQPLPGGSRALVPCYQRRSSPTYDTYRRRSPPPVAAASHRRYTAHPRPTCP